MPRPTHASAARALAERDEVIAALVETIGPPRIRAAQRTPFEALARAIAFQQLSGRAAATIHGRWEQEVAAHSPAGEVTPEAVLATPAEHMRRAGMSAAKTASVIDLAQKAVDGTVPLDRLAKLSDDDLVERLVVVRGIGRWTAEMFLIFQLRRLDVWPVDDLGVRKGYGRAYGMAEMPTPKALTDLGERFRPYRSVAAWYCWRATELTDAELPG